MPLPIRRWLASLRGSAAPEVMAAPVVAPDREAVIREELKWFNRFQGPPTELVAWFLAHGGTDDGSVHAYDVAGAIGKRRWILQGSGTNEDDQHFDGRTNWLPLMASGRDILIYEAGPGRGGIVRRRADRREQYVRDRAHPIPLARFATSLHAADAVEPAESEEPEPPPSALEQVLSRLGLRPLEREWDPLERLAFFTRGVPRALVEWFTAHDGVEWFPADRVRSSWRALGLDDAVVSRDLVLERASPALTEQLQADPRWLPLFSVEEQHFVLYSEERGLAFHPRVGDGFDVIPWSRWGQLDDFVSVTLRIFGAPAEGETDAWPLIAELQEISREIEDPQPPRSFDAPLPDPTLSAWFGANRDEGSPALAAKGEQVLSAEEALAQRADQFLPLIVGRDGIRTGWLEGLGMAHLTATGAIIPLAPTFTDWLECLLRSAVIERSAREEPGSITRNPMGVWTVDVGTLTAKDLIAALNALPWTFSQSGETLRLERAEETEVRIDVDEEEGDTTLVIRLAFELIDRMIADLEALEGFDPVTMSWEDVHDLVLVVRPKL